MLKEMEKMKLFFTQEQENQVLIIFSLFIKVKNFKFLEFVSKFQQEEDKNSLSFHLRSLFIQQTVN